MLNDCKYGHDIHNGVLRLTLLKGSTYPNPDADKGSHEFTYSLYPHAGDWWQANTVQHAYALNNPLIALNGKAQAGNLPEELFLFFCDSKIVVVEAIKKLKTEVG